MNKIKEFLTFAGYITPAGRLDKKEIAIDVAVIGGGLIVIAIVYEIVKLVTKTC